MKSLPNGTFDRGTRADPEKRRRAPDSITSLKVRIEKALRREFPRDTIDVSDGHAGTVNLVVVSRKFDDVPKRERTAMIRRLVEAHDFSKLPIEKLATISTFSPSELRAK